MNVPLKGQEAGYNDAYNFQLSQLTITIERAFGALVHRWSILRGPLLCSLPKVAPTITCLCRLHIFCIDANENSVEKMTLNSAQNIQRHFKFPNGIRGVSGINEDAIAIDENGCPTYLLSQGHYVIMPL